MKYGKYLTLLLFLLLCPLFVSAQDNVISKMVVKEVSGSTVAGSTTISGNTVTPDIDFYDAGDSVSYQLFVNYDSSKYKISYVSDNNKNRYVKTSYAVIDNKVFMTVTYPKRISPGYGVNPFKIFVKLQNKDGTPIIPDDVIVPPGFVNPPTGLLLYTIIGLLLISLIIIAFVKKKKHYLLLILLIPFLVYAKQSDTIEVNLNTDNIDIAYRVSFNGNGATGSMSSVTCYIGQGCQLPENQFTKSSRLFIGWSKSTTGEVLYIDLQETPDFGGNTTLYAVWKEGYIVHYNGNGAISGSMRDTNCASNESCTLRSNGYKKTNYKLIGWATSPSGEVSYVDEGTYTNITSNEEITLYAVWRKNYIVHYNGNGSTSGSMEDTLCTQDIPCTLKTNNYQKRDYIFGGWGTSSTGGATYVNEGTYTNITTGDEITLYVIWQIFSSQDFDYTGSAQTFTIPKSGNYKLEVWGAQGGCDKGGRGGYSYGTISLDIDTSLFIYVGGSGVCDNKETISGGFNGGGNASPYSWSYMRGSGGGGTDIRIGQDSLYARVIVAGGGGGAGSNHGNQNDYGGSGGGTQGEFGKTNVATTNSNYATCRGTETAGYTFGKGGNDVNNTGGGGGGGGWYGACGTRYEGGSGGSGYVYTESTATNYPSDCLLNSSYYMTDAQTIVGTSYFTSPTGSSEIGHSGNGYARITYLGN